MIGRWICAQILVLRLYGLSSLQSRRDKGIQFFWACHSGKSFSRLYRTHFPLRENETQVTQQIHPGMPEAQQECWSSAFSTPTSKGPAVSWRPHGTAADHSCLHDSHDGTLSYQSAVWGHQHLHMGSHSHSNHGHRCRSSEKMGWCSKYRLGRHCKDVNENCAHLTHRPLLFTTTVFLGNSLDSRSQQKLGDFWTILHYHRSQTHIKFQTLLPMSSFRILEQALSFCIWSLLEFIFKVLLEKYPSKILLSIHTEGFIFVSIH